MKKMEKKKVLVLIVAVGIGVGAISHLLLSSSFGKGRAETSVQKFLLENYAKVLSTDNTSYLVKNAVPVTENTYRLALKEVKGTVSEKRTGAAPENKENAFAPAPGKASESAEVPAGSYRTAKQTSEPILVFKETKSETKPPLLWPYSISLGMVASAVIAGVILSRQELRGSATSMLLEEDLENFSVRDAKILSQIMKLEEFTIPKLMKEAGTSKTTTWRTVKKLVENGLVRETDRTRAPSKGLGGRGKPSQVYEFTGKGKQ